MDFMSQPNSESASQALRIATNMAFWQSPRWVKATHSIYNVEDLAQDPAPKGPLQEARELLRLRASHDVIVTMGARESLAYALLCATLGKESRQIMTEVFIDTQRPGHPGWEIKNRLYRLASSRSIGMLTNSTEEIDTVHRRYQIPKERIRYVPLHTNIKQPRVVTTDDRFVLCAGRTLRDYDTLLEAAASFKLPLVVICGRHDLQSVALPEGTTVKTEIARDHYLKLVESCTVLALPLLNTERSTGQVVLLEAMALGKPVVTSLSPGTRDYVIHGENGLLIEVGDSHALAAEVNKVIDQPDFARKLGTRAVADTEKLYSIDRHARLKLEAIAELYELHRSRFA